MAGGGKQGRGSQRGGRGTGDRWVERSKATPLHRHITFSAPNTLFTISIHTRTYTSTHTRTLAVHAESSFYFFHAAYAQCLLTERAHSRGKLRHQTDKQPNKQSTHKLTHTHIEKYT